MRRTVAPAAFAGTIVLLSVASLALAAALGTTTAGFLAGNEASQWLGGLSIGLAGAAVLHASGNRLGPLLAVLGVLGALAATTQEYALLGHREGWVGSGLAAWWATFGWIPPLIGTLLAVPLLFPDGSLPSRRWRPAAAVGVGAAAAAVALAATTQVPLDDGGFGWMRNPLDLPWPDGVQLGIALGLLAVAALVGLTATVRILSLLPRQRGAERVRSALFAGTVLFGLATLVSRSVAVSFVLNVVAFGLLTLAILRYRLFEIEAYLPRALAYALCVSATMVVYLVVATMTTARAGPGYLPALGAAVFALAISRLLDRVNTVIAGLLFGERDRPELALAELGTRLASALDSEEVLPVAVGRLCESLRLPYAGIELDGQTGSPVSHGIRPQYVVAFELQHAGELVGVLTVGLRAGERSLAGSDRSTIGAFARQVAVAAHGVRATRELRRSREQVVLAREAERRRLHRDLHDGVGPALAGVSLGMETAARLVRRDPEGAVELIGELRQEAARCVDDLRTVIADLRPAALDEVGLAGSLVQHAHVLANQTGGRLRVEVVVDVGADPLPPAAEVAAYRIVTEALTNVARHSGATHAEVLVEAGEDLRIRVRDNGVGRRPARSGTGLASMRQRAEELGGGCTVAFRGAAGTEVSGVIPLRTGGGW